LQQASSSSQGNGWQWRNEKPAQLQKNSWWQLINLITAYGSG